MTLSPKIRSLLFPTKKEQKYATIKYSIVKKREKK